MSATKTTVLIDTREQAPWELPPGVATLRATLDAGDYTTLRLQGIAVIERKSVSDFAGSITRGRERLEDELRRLRGYRWRCLIIEGDVGHVWRDHNVHAHSVIGTVASFYARFEAPCLFAGTRAAATRLAFGILRRWEEHLDAEAADLAGAA